MDKHAILAVKKQHEPSIFLREYIKELCLGSLCENDVIYIVFLLQLRNANASCSIFHFAAISILFEFSVHSASVYLPYLPYDSSDEEVWEKRR